MLHTVRLSNGKILAIEEGDESLSIASMHNGEVDAYICEITPRGSLVMPNSGDAAEMLCDGLRYAAAPRRTSSGDGVLCYSVDGINWSYSPNGIRVALEDAMVDDDSRGDVIFNFRDNGLIEELSTNEGTVTAGISARTYDEIISQLHD